MSTPITVLERKPVETELVEREYTYEELLEMFPDGGESIVNPLVRRCQEYEAEIERLKARLREQTLQTQQTAEQIHSAVIEALGDAIPDGIDANGHPTEQVVATTISTMRCDHEMLKDEIERLRAYTDACNTLLAERVEIECLRGLAIRAWHSFRSGLSATGGCRDGLTDGDILELVRLSNIESAKLRKHPPA